MEHAQVGSLLPIVETIHWVALAFMGTVYVLRVMWLLKFKAGRDRQAPGERHGDTSLYPAAFSLGNVAMPWVMESTRTNLPFYANFVWFHVGAVTGISFAILSSLVPSLFQVPAVAAAFLFIIFTTFFVAAYRVYRRFTDPVLKLISTPDDYFAIMTLTVWLGLGSPAVAYAAGWVKNENWMVAFLIATSFFLIYVPFSKISHYLYYPFTRIWIGRTLGHRGSMPAAKARG